MKIRSYYIMGIILLILIQLTGCHLPTAEEMEDGVFNPTEIEGNNYEISMMERTQNECDSEYTPPKAENEAFQFVDNTLILIRGDEKHAFIRTSESGDEYCRELEGNERECIQWTSNKEYNLVVREPDPFEPGVDRYCYEAVRHLSPSNDNPEDESDSNLASDDQLLGECRAPAAVTWKYNILSSGEGYCSADFTVTNTGQETVWLKAYDVFDNNAMESQKWGSWKLEPGEEFTDRTSLAHKSDGLTYAYYSKLVVIRDVSGCLWLANSDKESTWMTVGIEIPPPCD